MTPLESVALLLTFASAAGYLNQRWLRLPPAIGMMLMSVGCSLILVLLGRIGVLHLETAAAVVRTFDFQELFLHGLLSLLLFSGALFVDVSALKRWVGPVAALSTAGVVLSAAVTGTALWAIAGLLGSPIPWAWCALFGALIAPTDPLAALAIVKQAGAPPHLRMKLVGESLFNDGTGVVLFLALLAFAQHGVAEPLVTAAWFAWSLLGGLCLGAGMGWLTLQALARVDHYAVEIMLTLALATGSYALAEAMHASAPIATVMAGLVIGHKARPALMSQRTQEHLDTFWETLDEILNAALFALMGLELLVIQTRPDHVVLGIIAWGCVLVGRWFGVVLSLVPYRRRTAPGTVAVLTWGGLRGGISLALALSLPESPHTVTLIVLTYVVVVLSALVQGTSLGVVVRRAIHRGAGTPDGPPTA